MKTMELRDGTKAARNFVLQGEHVMCDWEAVHPRHGALEGKASPVYIAREMGDQDVIAAVKGCRFPSTAVIVRGERGGKPFYIVFPKEEATAAFLGFLEENGLSARVAGIRERLEADRVAAEEREQELRRQREEAAAARAAEAEEIKKTSIRGFYRSEIVNDYGPVPVEVHYGIGWFTCTAGGYYYFADILPHTPLSAENPVLAEGLRAEPLGTNEMGGLTAWPCTEAQETAALAAEEICREERERSEKAAAEKAAQEKAERTERARRELEAAMETELAYFDETPLANITHLLLHSLGACERDGVIAIYETRYCKEFGAPGTYDLRDEIKALGATWDAGEREWKLPLSEENRGKVVAFLQKHDVKKDPVALGYSRCWECGVWHRGRVCPCCGE